MKENIFIQLKNMDLKPNDNIMIHSSLKAINLDANELIDALLDYFNEGMVLMPTHTWELMGLENPNFDVESEPSNVGLLTEIFRNRAGVIRNNHPTHSTSGFGNGVEAFLAGAEDDYTPASPSGVWGRLPSINAKVLLVGVNFDKNTFIHAIEEKVDVPNRFTNYEVDFNITTKDETIKRKFRKHYSPFDYGISNHYVKIENELLDNGILKLGRLGYATVKYYDTIELEDYLIDKLNRDIEFFSEP